MNTRQEVEAAIDSELAYQDHLAKNRGWDNEERTPAKSTGDYLTLLDTYVRRAHDAWADNCGDQEALKVVRKVAAIAVRCMLENGAIPRE